MLRQEVIRQRNEAYFRTLVQDASDAIMIVGDDGTVKYATPSTTTIFGEITVEGALSGDLVADGERDDFARTFMQLRDRARAPGPATWTSGSSAGTASIVHIQARCSDLRDEPTVAGLVFTLRDVTEQHQLEEELKHQAFHDALTGLPNRLLLPGPDRAAARRDQARRHDRGRAVRRPGRLQGRQRHDGPQRRRRAAGGGRQSGSPAWSATRTPPRGSAATSSRCSSATPRTPPRSRRPPTAWSEAFSEPFALATGAVLTAVTVGVATTTDSADTDELLRHADLALYAAKAAGKRQWRRYQPVLSAGLVRRRELQAALEEAVGPLRVHAGLPADRRPRHRGARRVRGAGPVAASAVGHDAARPVHRPGRRDRPDHRARLLGAGPGRRRHGAMASVPAPGPPDQGRQAKGRRCRSSTAMRPPAGSTSA